ncbi:MAG: flagellar M-ring protein FliF [Spirochaetes bacterium]|nr:flagellar M-ring protein FliF [Spirochaetota bacterium]
MEFLKKLLTQGTEIFSKLSTTKKIIMSAIIGVIVIAFIVLFSISSENPTVVLFSDLNSTDFGQVTTKLDELGYPYKTTGTADIFVNPEDREVILTKLSQEKMIPKGIPGWQLFDLSKWTETDRELDVKYMRALRDEVKRHIESLKNIARADVDIAITEEDLFRDKQSLYTAAVTVHLADGYESLKQKEIEGIVYLVSRAVGNKLPTENVTVTDDKGNIISDFDDEYIKGSEDLKLVEKRKKIEEETRIKYLRDIKSSLERTYGEDRIQIVRLSMEFNWDKVSEKQNIVEPVIMQKDDPKTPYSELKVQDSLTVSEKNTQEDFKGHGFNPQGPAGTDATTPPGYAGADDQFTEYKRNETIKNNEFNKTERNTVRDDFDLEKISVAVLIDGKQSLPKNPDGSWNLDPAVDPVQTPVSPEELKTVEDSIKAAIGYNGIRGDQVTVKNIMFDRSGEWEAIREEYLKKEQMKNLVLAALIGVFALFLGFILYTAIRKEFARRRRIREEQLALEQQRMREAALRAAEEEGVDVELSLEDKARLELQENAINLAKERPDDVAQLLRTWLAEE